MQAKTIPDDLYLGDAALHGGLAAREPVVAVGFPFGIGLSVSAGDLGPGREYQTADGKRVLTNLIQFDAAVNPAIRAGRPSRPRAR